ncbi:MAG: hypothetical protein CM1200mP39_13390 [Dehalococcoidia bacterium]|nr:MAG: hypothetical protein CM1200mP39_13390 [Dehalococcoidia bacterium]
MTLQNESCNNTGDIPFYPRGPRGQLMTDRVVVTGIGLVTPVGLNSESTWNSLVEGKGGNRLYLPI